MTLEETVKKIKPLDEEKMETARRRWDSIAKPLHSLGKMEDLITQIVGITGEIKVDISKKALVAMCADNGVVEEGVTQTGQEVTAIVADNFVKETTTACVMCHQCGVAVKPVDVGMVRNTTARTDLKVMYGTRNMTKGPAMSREEAQTALMAGAQIAMELDDQDVALLAAGEMGIGNTTTSAAVLAALTGLPVEAVTGRGGGMTDAGFLRKKQVITDALALHCPDKNDVLDVLCKVGGLDIAAMCGVFLGAARQRLPVVIDGFISVVAALCARRLCPAAGDYFFASHASHEVGYAAAVKELGLEPWPHLGMRLGEGSGCPIAFRVMEAACAAAEGMATFEGAAIDDSYLDDIRGKDCF